MKSLRVLTAVTACAGMALAQAGIAFAQSSVSGAAFDKLKTLAGEWEGTVNEDGKPRDTMNSFRVVSDGSALMSLLNAGSKEEMVTMFHMDGSDLLATHYCAVHNQPRFRYVSSSKPDVVEFKFKDATNLSSSTAPHMVGLKITFVDAQHHYEDWTFFSDGKARTTRFDFRRKL